MTKIIRYAPRLKRPARVLRATLTDSERRLWSRLRRKQLHGMQFYRQKPIGDYIVDFYAPAARLVVEIDGSQHGEPAQANRDARRDRYLAGIGLQVMRFNSSEVIKDTVAVVETIHRAMAARLAGEIPPHPPSWKGGLCGASRSHSGCFGSSEQPDGGT
ncbi:endonuclease domain-containing protein [Candidatus Fermentibacteria bacterium]|nr:endonuclease domain-containing protein [Candidatus Fermentibacteria bacterium]